MKTYSGGKIEVVKKNRSQRSSSFDFLTSFVSTLWLSSLWLPRLALCCFARHATQLVMLTSQPTSIAFS
jgi:hypothetical protein